MRRCPYRRRRLSSAVAVAVAVGTMVTFSPGREARANGRYPTAMQLVKRPGHPDDMALRATFGVLLSADRGQNWDWICESAMGYGPRSDYLLAVTSTGAHMMASLEGLTISRDGGCNWAFAGGPLDKKEVIDVTVFGGLPSSALAIAADGTIAITHDDGVTFAPYGVVDPSTRPITIDVAPSDPTRVYVSALRSNGTTLTGAFFVSKDSGATFMEYPIALLPDERAAYIAAIDPSNADRVYLRTGDDSGSLPSRLLVSDDGGASFSARYSGEQMLGFALSSDGSTVYLGGVQNGLHAASTTNFAFGPRLRFPVQCLAFNEAGLWGCSNEANGGFFIGLSTNGGADFAPLLVKRNVRGPLSCSDTSSVAKCIAEWPDNQYILGMVDAGPVDAGAIISLDGGRLLDDGRGSKDSDDGEGCGVSPAGEAKRGPMTGLLIGLGAVLLGVTLRARRKRG